MVEHIRARVARAFRAASAAAFERQPEPADNSVSGVLVDVAEMAETTGSCDPEWSAALAVLLRELAPDPVGALGMTIALMRLMRATDGTVSLSGPALAAVLTEHDRRGAELEVLLDSIRILAEELTAEREKNEETTRQLVRAQALSSGDPAAIAELRAENEHLRVQLCAEGGTTAGPLRSAAEHGRRDGLIDWLNSVSWTSGPEAYEIPVSAVDAVAATFRRKVEAIADALIARDTASETRTEWGVRLPGSPWIRRGTPADSARDGGEAFARRLAAAHGEAAQLVFRRPEVVIHTGEWTPADPGPMSPGQENQ